MAAQTLPVHVLLQHSAPAVHAPEFATHRSAPHFPLEHVAEQHSVGALHAVPLPRHAALVMPHVLDVGSHAPPQHAAPLEHDCPGAPQLTAAPSEDVPPPLAPATGLLVPQPAEPKPNSARRHAPMIVGRESVMVACARESDATSESA